jgi:hypothetical protein
MGNIKVITNSSKPEPISEPNNKTKSNIGMISSTIPTISLKYSREYSYKTPDIIIFL